MFEDRHVTKRAFADLFRDPDIHPVDDYPTRLFDLLASPRPGGVPAVVVLTPGVFNSACFEHAFVARQMGVPLVEGSDLVVGADDCVCPRTIGGLYGVDVVYRPSPDRGSPGAGGTPTV
jgi:uncharacterized circularly permuted ATP-grasp superfamily protein